MRPTCLAVMGAFSLILSPGLTGCGDDHSDHGHDHDGSGGPVDEAEFTQGRLAIADGDTTLHFIDLDEGVLAGTLATTARSRVYANRDGRFVYAVQGTGDRVEIFESGIALVSHIDHFHISKGEPTRLELRLEGPAPSHFVLSDGFGTVFHDGDGSARFVRERSIAAGTPMIGTAQTGRAHHGAAMVYRNHVLASIPSADMDQALPIGVSIRTVQEPDTTVDRSEDCPALHGETVLDHAAVFACLNGLLVVDHGESGLSFRKIAYPSTVAAGTRMGSLAGHGHHVVGNWGEIGLALVDIAGNAPEFSVLETESRILAFDFDRRGEHVVALTASGELLVFERRTGALEHTVQVMDPVMLGGGGEGSVRPALALGAEAAYVSDPRAGSVYEILVESGEIVRTFEIGGMPHSLAVVRMSPDWDAQHDGHDH